MILPFPCFAGTEVLPSGICCLIPWCGRTRLNYAGYSRITRYKCNSQDQDVIETFSPHTVQEPFADYIRLWRTTRRLQYFDRRPYGDPRESFPIFTIAIPNQKARRLPEERRFAQLLGYPGIRW